MSQVTANIETVEVVEYLQPGSFFPEEYTERVNGRSIEELAAAANPRVFAFTTYKYDRGESVFNGRPVEISGKAYDKSGRYYLGGTVYTLDELKAVHADKPILISNMQGNGWQRVIQTPLGNWQPLKDEDTVLPR